VRLAAINKDTAYPYHPLYVLRVKARPDYEPLFSILDDLRLDSERRYWIEHRDMEGNINDLGVNTRQMGTAVEIVLQMSHNTLTRAEEYI
jgi:hypothetical protein